MKFRDHPLMTRKSGMSAWPPLWISTDASRLRPKGEVGILMRASKHESIENALFVWVDHEAHIYIGAMNFDDTAFCREVQRVLEFSIGLTIKEIGDLDFSYTL